MQLHNVDLIRRYTLRKVNELRIYISSLPEREDTALQKLYGQVGIDTAARIAEFVLACLGHEPPAGVASSKLEREPTIDTLKAAKKVTPGRAAMER